MHELAVTRNIVDIVLRTAHEQKAHRVLRVHLVVGKMRNFERDWVQRYYDRLAKGTVAAGARVDIDYVPIVFYCNDCGATFQMELGTGARLHCVACGGDDYNMITGGELMIKDIEIA